jgi:hypothetical protein
MLYQYTDAGGLRALALIHIKPGPREGCWPERASTKEMNMNRLTSTAAPVLIGVLAVSFAGSAGAVPLSSGSVALRAVSAPVAQPVQWRGAGWRLGGWRGGWGGWRGGWDGWRGGWGWGRWGGGLAAGALVGGAIAAAPYYGSGYAYGCDCDAPYYDDYAPSYSTYYYPSYYGSYGSYGYSPYHGGYWPGYRRAFFHYW